MLHNKFFLIYNIKTKNKYYTLVEKFYYLVRTKYVLNIHLEYCKLFVALFVGLSVCMFHLKFFCISESFICMQIKLELFSPGIASALENKVLLSLFRVYRKSSTSAQKIGRTTKDEPLYTGTNFLLSSFY